MSNVKLLPCPFKHDPEPTPGSEMQADLEVTRVPWAEDYTVLCTWCAACGPMKKTEEEAIAAWNSQHITSYQELYDHPHHTHEAPPLLKPIIRLKDLPSCDETEDPDDLPDPFA